MTKSVTHSEVVDTALEAKKAPVVVPEYKNLGPVFGKEGMSWRQVTHAKNVGDLRVQIESLKKLQEMNPTPERNQQIIDLDREWGRNTRFMNLHNRGTAEQKKLLEKRETFDDLKASDLLMLKKNWADLANLLLVSDTNPTGSVTRDAIKEKDKFIVNFGESKNINNVIGAGDILPPTVNQVKIISKKYPEGIIATRWYDQRPGYYDNSKKPPTYIAIYDGDKIEVMKMGTVDEKVAKEASESEEKWLRDRRIEDMIDNDGKALSDLPEDKELEAKAQEQIKQRKEIRESIGTMRKWKFFWTTDKPISETVKALKDLNVAETNNLLKKIFGQWPATDLLIAIDDGSTFAIKRMITLAYHEGWLHFGRQNPDPASGFNIGTFQIGGRNSTPESSMHKYERCLHSWVLLAWQKNIPINYEMLKNDAAQRDLLAHLWYIQLERRGSETFGKLRDGNLSESEVVNLMHHDIQWGIEAIGRSVVAQVNNTKIDLEQIRSV